MERGELPARLDVELASIYLQSLWDGICGTLAWTERLRDDPWNRAERMFRAGLDSLRSSPYLLLADAIRCLRWSSAPATTSRWASSSLMCRRLPSM